MVAARERHLVPMFWVDVGKPGVRSLFSPGSAMLTKLLDCVSVDKVCPLLPQWPQPPRTGRARSV